MNKKKSQKGLSLGTFFVVLTAAALVAGGGIFYVIVKNEQVQTQRQIAKIERQINDHNVAITGYRADIEDHLGRYRLRQQLEEKNSSLVAIPSGFVEICQRNTQIASEFETETAEKEKNKALAHRE